MDFNELVYKCASDRFCKMVEELESNRITHYGITDFGNLSAIIPAPPYIILVFLNGQWAILHMKHTPGKQTYLTMPTTKEFVLWHNKCGNQGELRSVLVSTRLMSTSECDAFLRELSKARHDALMQLEQEQLQDKYPDEVSQ